MATQVGGGNVGGGGVDSVNTGGGPRLEVVTRRRGSASRPFLQEVAILVVGVGVGVGGGVDAGMDMDVG